MSLNWSVEDVEDYKNLCWIENPENPDGTKILNPITESLVFATMSVGINHITEDNAYDFFVRSGAAAVVYGDPITIWEDGNFTRRNYTFEEIKQHIGLSTNASVLSLKEFWDNMIKGAKRYNS